MRTISKKQVGDTSNICASNSYAEDRGKKHSFEFGKFCDRELEKIIKALK